MKKLGLSLTIITTSLVIFTSSSHKDLGKKKVEGQRGFILSAHGEVIARSKGDKRSYLYGKELAHITGYVQNQKQKDGTLKSIGKHGVEKRYEETLAQGKDLNLNIDMQIQLKAYTLLEKKGMIGAIVVQDPNNGKIIALASYPSFDSNLFVPKISQANYEMLSNDPSRPFRNRAILSHNAGFVLAPLTALSAESKGLKNPTIHCNGTMKLGEVMIHDWKRNRNEKLNISSAIEDGCGMYFMQLALKTGLPAMEKMAIEMGLREHQDPITAKVTKNQQFWKQTNSKAIIASYGTGHGSSITSPLQLSKLTSAIATGVLRKPVLVRGDELLNKPLVGIGGITKHSLETIRKGMQLSFNHKNSLAKEEAIKALKITGISATTQQAKGNHAGWFTGYAPYDKPEYTVTVFLKPIDGADKEFSGRKDAMVMATEMFKALLVDKELK